MIQFEVPITWIREYPDKLVRQATWFPISTVSMRRRGRETAIIPALILPIGTVIQRPMRNMSLSTEGRDALAFRSASWPSAERRSRWSKIQDAWGFHFILNDDKLAARIKERIRRSADASITRSLTLTELQQGDFRMYDRIVLFHWFARHLQELPFLPKDYQYVMICNSGATMITNGMTGIGFWADTLEEYRKESDIACSACMRILEKVQQQSSIIEPEDLSAISILISAATNWWTRYDETDTIFNNLYSHAMRSGEWR